MRPWEHRVKYYQQQSKWLQVFLYREINCFFMLSPWNCCRCIHILFCNGIFPNIICYDQSWIKYTYITICVFMVNHIYCISYTLRIFQTAGISYWTNIDFKYDNLIGNCFWRILLLLRINAWLYNIIRIIFRSIWFCIISMYNLLQLKEKSVYC